jgi:putative cardiolipin synthase
MLNVRSKLNIFVGLLFGLVTFSSANAAVTGSVTVSNAPHRIVILNESAPALKKRVDMIREAKGSIEIETWNFDLSRSSRLLLRELIAKKQAMPSIGIRIILDYYVAGGLAAINPAVSEALAKLGIQVRYYNQVDKTNLIALNHRDHSKLFIVDGSEFIIGSRNLSDEHFGLGEGLNYIDTDFWVSGPIARSVQMAFYEFWNSSIVKDPDGSFGYSKPDALTYMDDRDRAIALNLEDIGTEALAALPVYQVNRLSFVKDGPLNEDSERKVTAYVNYQLARINHSLLIENWGFIPDDVRLSILDNLMAKGVKIELLTNGFDQHFSETLSGMGWMQEQKEIPKGLATSYYNASLTEAHLDNASAAHFSVYETHSKTAVRDMRYVDVGSYNWDGRSAHINHEDLLTVDSPEIAQFMTGVIRTRISRSDKISADGKNQKGQSILPPSFQGAKLWFRERFLGLEEDLIGDEF